MDRWIQKVISKWKSEGVKLNPPATIVEIERAQTALDFKFSQDFKDFYLQVNGFAGLDWQEHMFSIWSLERIVDECAGFSNKNFIGFCDFLLSSLYIGFDKKSQRVFKLYLNVEDGECIAQTFEQAIDMINSSND